MLKGAENPDGAQAFIDFMQQRSFQEALPDNMYVFPVDDRRGAARRRGSKYAEAAPKPFTVPPAEIAREPRRPGCASGATSPPDEPPMSHRTGGAAPGLAALAALPLVALAVFFVLPVGGHGRPRVLRRTAGSTPAACSRCSAAPACTRCCGSRVWSAALATVGHRAARAAGGASCCYRLRFPGRRLLRAFVLMPFVMPTVVVGVAFRTLLAPSGPLGAAAARRHPGRDHRRDGVLQPRRRGAHGRRAVGGPRPAPRGGRGGPRRLAAGRCCAPSPCPR